MASRANFSKVVNNFIRKSFLLNCVLLLKYIIIHTPWHGHIQYPPKGYLPQWFAEFRFSENMNKLKNFIPKYV